MIYGLILSSLLLLSLLAFDVQSAEMKVELYGGDIQRTYRTSEGVHDFDYKKKTPPPHHDGGTGQRPPPFEHARRLRGLPQALPEVRDREFRRKRLRALRDVYLRR